MKKLLGAVLTIASLFTIASCGTKKTLKVLNWGDYVKDDLIKDFEKENKCKVQVITTTSNEDMYVKIRTKTDKYDIAVPSDYMIDKLNKGGLLNKIDTSKLSNYSTGMFRDSLEALIDKDGAAYKDYFVPYFWGSLGIMYNKQKSGLEDKIKTNGFNVFFEDEFVNNYNVGMYESSRDSFACAEAYLGYSFNTQKDEELRACRDLLKKCAKKYSRWGDDNLKTDVASGELDYALVYSGDYFDQRYQYMEADMDPDSKFGLYAPTDANNVFYDGLVIPTTSENTDLAHKFIDFFLDTDNSFDNTDFVGYAPVIEAVHQEFVNLSKDSSGEDYEYYKALMEIDAFDPTKITNGEVYKYISIEYDDRLEGYYTEVRGN